MIKGVLLLTLLSFPCIINATMTGSAARTTDPVNAQNLAVVLNDLRKNPSKYADIIQKEYIDKMDSNGKLHTVARINYNEGTSAMTEARDALKNQAALPEMKLELGMTIVAYNHAVELEGRGLLSHTGSNGSTFSQRLNIWGSPGSPSAENIAISTSKATSTDVVLQYIIDDGVASRGHRKNFLNASLLSQGFSSKTSSTGKIYSVWVGAGSWTCNTKCDSATAAEKSASGFSSEPGTPSSAQMLKASFLLIGLIMVLFTQ